MAALTDRKALWVLDYSAVRVTIDMAGEREHQKVPITSRARLSVIYLVVSSLSVIKPKINESPVSIMIKILGWLYLLDLTHSQLNLDLCNIFLNEWTGAIVKFLFFIFSQIFGSYIQYLFKIQLFLDFK